MGSNASVPKRYSDINLLKTRLEVTRSLLRDIEDPGYSEYRVTFAKHQLRNYRLLGDEGRNSIPVLQRAVREAEAHHVLYIRDPAKYVELRRAELQLTIQLLEAEIRLESRWVPHSR